MRKKINFTMEAEFEIETDGYQDFQTWTVEDVVRFEFSGRSLAVKGIVGHMEDVDERAIMLKRHIHELEQLKEDKLWEKVKTKAEGKPRNQKNLKKTRKKLKKKSEKKERNKTKRRGKSLQWS